MIVSRTPYRISLLGGGTDYPAWFKKHGGAVLATSIDKYCYLTCRYLPPFFEHRIRVVYSSIENCHTIDEIKHPAVREVLRYLNIDRGVEIHHDGDLPARSGMGTSSAFVVGLLHALYALKGQIRSKRELALEGIHIEQERLNETVGSQDQVLAAYGGFNHIVFHPNGEIAVKPMTLSPDCVKELNAHLMLFYTGISRTAAVIADSYANELESRKRQLRLMKDLVEEAISLLGSGREIGSFGEMLHEAWQAKRSLSNTVSNHDVDEIYEQAIEAGATGGKLTGAGGGGFMLLFVPTSKQEAVKDRLRKLVWVPFKFSPHGSEIVFYDPEQDYSLTERVSESRRLACE